MAVIPTLAKSLEPVVRPIPRVSPGYGQLGARLQPPVPSSLRGNPAFTPTQTLQLPTPGSRLGIGGAPVPARQVKAQPAPSQQAGVGGSNLEVQLPSRVTPIARPAGYSLADRAIPGQESNLSALALRRQVRYTPEKGFEYTTATRAIDTPHELVPVSKPADPEALASHRVYRPTAEDEAERLLDVQRINARARKFQQNEAQATDRQNQITARLDRREFAQRLASNPILQGSLAGAGAEGLYELAGLGSEYNQGRESAARVQTLENRLAQLRQLSPEAGQALARYQTPTQDPWLGPVTR